MEAGSVQREPLYFGGVMSFEAVWKGLREQDMAVIFGVLVGMLVLDVSNLSVKKLLLDLFCGVGSGAENFIVPVFPNSEAQIPEISNEGVTLLTQWIEMSIRYYPTGSLFRAE